MNSTRICSILIGLLLAGNLMAQERLQSTKLYSSGNSFAAPLYGLNVVVPEGWSGFYPKGSEVFTMTNDSAQVVQCMYFANKTDLKSLKSNWKKGFPLASGLAIELEGKMELDYDIMIARIGVTGRADVKGTILARCGEFGVCITALVYGPSEIVKPYFTNLTPLLSEIEFVKPVSREVLDVFDWQKELTGKYLLGYERDVASKKQSQVWLYLDGTFKSKFSRTGMFKGSVGKYKGTKKGSYLIYNEDQGEPAKLVLLYKGLPEVELSLTRKDGKHYINDHVFYYSEM